MNKIRFLCVNHREELQLRPERALSCWRNTHESGLSFIDIGSFNEALPHMGCAFETAEIMLGHNLLDKSQLLNLFTNSALYLAATLNALSYQQEKMLVLEATLQRLQQETAGYPEANTHIQAVEAKLYENLKLH